MVLPIPAQDDRDFFVEVATGPWDDRKSGEALDKAAILRSSDHAGAGLEILAAIPCPPRSSSTSAPRRPHSCSSTSRGSHRNGPRCARPIPRGREQPLGCRPRLRAGYLPLVEELLMAALEGDEAHDSTPLSGGLVSGLGCFLGEIIRRNVSPPGVWRPPEWGEGPVVEIGDFVLDPVGKARAFLEYGQRNP